MSSAATIPRRVITATSEKKAAFSLDDMELMMTLAGSASYIAAPTAMQLVHLLVADAVWLATVTLTACAATEAAAPAARSDVEADVREEVVLRGEVAHAPLLPDVHRKA